MFQIKSFRHDLVCDRKYLFSGNGRRFILLHAYSAKQKTRYRQEKTEGAANLYDIRIYRHRLRKFRRNETWAI